MRALALLGRDHTRLGPLALAALPDGGALALSRGAHDKPYRYTEPNEDAALLVRTGQGALLAVADGYNGADASHAAIAAARARADALLAPDAEAFRRAVRDLIDALARSDAPGRARTCLVLAALRGTRCECAQFGDSLLFRAGAAEPVVPPNPLVLGPGMQLAGEPGLWHYGFELALGERVALVSDGVTNFARDPARLHTLLATADDDLAAARALAESALRGGAGDNVSAAVIAAPPTL